MPPDPTPLTGTLFGRPSLSWRGQPVQARSQKGQALLYALCLQPGGFSRSELAELLWSQGRVQNVRQELTALRGLPGAAEWLDTRDHVRVRASTDATKFEAACREARFDDAIELYRAPLLAGLEVPRAPAFIDWLDIERRRLEDLLRHALRSQANALEEAAQYDRALQLLDRLIGLDSLDETAYRTAMRLNYKLGNLKAALDYFVTCRRVLLAELEAEPLDETVELHDRIAAEYEHAQRLAEQRARDAAGAVNELSGIALRLAQTLALAGDPLPVDLVAEVVEAAPREVAATFEALTSRGLLAGQELTPAAVSSVRAATPRALRLYLHARAARALIGAEGPPAEIASHLLAAHEPEEAGAWQLEASRAAEGALDMVGARNHLFRALWASRDPRKRIELLQQLERIATLTADAALREAALGTLEEEAFVLQDDVVLIDSRLRRAMQLVQAGRSPEALELAEETADCARRIERPDLLPRVNHLIGAAAFHTGNLERAGTAFAYVAEHGTPAEQLRALNNLGALAGIRADLDEALRHQEQALTIARSLGDRSVTAGVLNNLGATSERAARYEKAARSFAEAAKLFAALEDPHGGAVAWTNAADVLLKQGRHRECQEALTQARQLGGMLDAPALMCRIQLLDGVLLQSRGEYAAALEALGVALELATEMQDERLTAVTRYNLEMTRLRADAAYPPETVLGAVAALEEMQLNDVLPWAYAELGQLSATPDDARAWSEKLQGFDANPHLRLLRLLIEQRARALAGDHTAVPGLARLAEELQVAETAAVTELLATVS